MKSALIPRTTLGKWSVGLAVGLVFFFLVSVAIVNLGHQTGGNTFFDNLYISVPMLVAGLSGVAAFFTGLICIIRYKERSALTFISTAIGIFAVLMLAGEFLAPH